MRVLALSIAVTCLYRVMIFVSITQILLVPDMPCPANSVDLDQFVVPRLFEEKWRDTVLGFLLKLYRFFKDGQDMHVVFSES